MFINNQIYKKHIRNNIRIIRRSLTTVYKNTESIKIAKLFLNFIKLFDFKNISIFLSFDGEINTYPIILQLWLNKKNVYLPVIYSFQEKN